MPLILPVVYSAHPSFRIQKRYDCYEQSYRCQPMEDGLFISVVLFEEGKVGNFEKRVGNPLT